LSQKSMPPRALTLPKRYPAGASIGYTQHIEVITGKVSDD